jgi:hypothetical protein
MLDRRICERQDPENSLHNKDLALSRLARTSADAHYPRMFPSHTRKPAAKSWLLGIVALLICVDATAMDRGTMLRIELETAPANAARMPHSIAIRGKAPAHCTPIVGRVTLDGADLSIELGTPQTACDEKHPTSFNLRVDPLASTGLPLLPGQVYRVRVYSTDSGAPELAAFHLLDTSAAASAPTPESGFWWSEASAETGAATAGSGASIEWQDGQLAVGLFGFADSGAATWYFGSARPDGRVASVSLVQLANGDPMFAPTGSKPAAQTGPRLEIEFLSPARARAWLVRNEDGHDTQVRTLTLARSHFATGAIGNTWSGQWVLVPDDNGTPRVFEFADPSSRDAETFHLADVGNDASLDCRLASISRHPEVCTLSAASAPIADFDQIGIDHLSGRGSDGAHVKLVRVPR